MAEDPAAVWSRILDRLEFELASLLSGNGPTGWAAPADAGPIPPELADRAARVLDAQRETEQMLQQTRHTAAQHLSAVNAVPVAQAAGPSLYLDVSG